MKEITSAPSGSEARSSIWKVVVECQILLWTNFYIKFQQVTFRSDVGYSPYQRQGLYPTSLLM